MYNPLDLIPRVPLGDWIDTFINWLLFHVGDFTRALATILRSAINSFNDGLMLIPPLLLIIFFSVIAWRMSNRSVGLFSFFGLVLIYNMGLWAASMETLAMVLLAATLSIVIGLPVGIVAARKELVHQIVWPILDLMQTMPAFVYLIPVIFFFRLGAVPAVMATVIFSMPPVIRLTGLGIQQVPRELVEASEAFGSTEWQKLVKVQLPLALPTIMAGVNQCIMLSLSMVVIAAMIGAGGLGGAVWRSIQRLDIGGGFESGLAVVVVAIVLDRVTQRVRKTNSSS
ncbi:ABC transporter permease [Candidatus Contubernalis alkaliaceticus]|uniref:ABC transporter permease n=1 Tax=Candidatus Contubernalis alkaliaceticus TaxID=338645 RepID=UPI001F4C50AD|nr:proline/glycine betaine ABC transporter permease [Candidatus Contubernalis alkalaceticus]UNC90747.1 proline/glycine betaine ABC transporter permease [Candidatus Contubernalis alkalaceticus]